MTLLNRYAKQTNKQKEIRMAVRCHRITTALHFSQATYITYIERSNNNFLFSHFVSNQISGSFFKWCYHEAIAQHKNYMSMRYLFHPTRRKPFSYKLLINNKKKKKMFPLERNIRIMHNSCQLLSWEKNYMKEDRKWLLLFICQSSSWWQSSVRGSNTGNMRQQFSGKANN